MTGRDINMVTYYARHGLVYVTCWRPDAPGEDGMIAASAGSTLGAALRRHRTGRSELRVPADLDWCVVPAEDEVVLIDRVEDIAVGLGRLASQRRSFRDMALERAAGDYYSALSEE